MIKVGLIGGRGYAGEELLRLLAKLPDYEVIYVGSRSKAGSRLDSEYEGLEVDLRFADLTGDSIRSCQADAWVIAQSNGEAKSFVDILDETKTRIIDISADYRFDSSWVYGLPERNPAAIRSADHVSNPGCYATAMQLALLPLIDQINSVPVAFGISGFSGAGRTPGDKNNPDRLANNILPYSLTGHLHEREVTHQLGREIRFAPHVASFFRGISMTVALSVNPDDAMSAEQLLEHFTNYYSEHSLVEIMAGIPEIRQVAETNRSIVGGFAVDERNPGRITIVSVIDNLRKGAASQAVQNLNLMFGMKSERGLA